MNQTIVYQIPTKDINATNTLHTVLGTLQCALKMRNQGKVAFLHNLLQFPNNPMKYY